MAEEHKALSDTTELTETVYFVHPTGIYVLSIYLILAHAIGCQVHEIQIYLILKLN